MLLVESFLAPLPQAGETPRSPHRLLTPPPHFLADRGGSLGWQLANQSSETEETSDFVFGPWFGVKVLSDFQLEKKGGRKKTNNATNISLSSVLRPSHGPWKLPETSEKKQRGEKTCAVWG